ILVMMQTVASHKAENRMSSSAVAACMAPLLLRPLLAGDCELENDFDVGGDGSMQLLQAAAAANHAQAIVVTLLEEYDKIFGEGSMSPELYSETEDSGSESEEATDDDESYEDEDPDDGSQYSEIYTDDETENVSSRSNSRSYDDEGSTHTGKTDGDGSTSGSHHSSVAVDHFKENDELSPSAHQTSLLQRDQSQKTNNLASHQGSRSLEEQKNNEPTETLGDTPATSQVQNSAATSSMSKSTTIASGQIPSSRRPAVWGRTPAKKNLSMESIDIFLDDEAEIQKLENAKEDLRNRITEEAKENAVLRANLENQKIAVHERRQVLEQEVARLQEQLQKEKDLRRALEAGLKEPRGPIPCSANIDEKKEAKWRLSFGSFTHLLIRSTHAASCSYGCRMSKTDETKTADTPCPAERSNSSKRSNSDGTQTEKKRMDQPSTQQQQLDSVGSVKSRNIDQSANSSAADSGSGKPFPPLSSKKSGARGEGTNSTASALSKLTNRLNFLKERRTQITKELQSTDKSQNLDKGRSADMSTGSGSSNQEDKRGTEDTPSNPDKSRNPDTQEELNRGRASDQGQADRTLELSIPSRTDSRSS
ncbi:hypothetical protein CRG98_039195, partial [Punica granatum]